MKLKILIGILVFLIAVNLATIGSYIYFQMQDHDEAVEVPMAERFRGRFPSPPHLDLDSEQRHQLFELRISFEKDTKTYSDKIKELRNDIFVMIKDDSVTINEIEAKLEEISKLRMQIEKVAIRKLIEARHYLSPMQQNHLFRFLLMERPERPHFKDRVPFQQGPGFMRGKGEINNLNNKNKE